ncbi:hypothetical protein JOC86_002187 [Bacillus pakistanensis]|uniref:Uncharacterized protein n=1 Tax=Rossellomorea pakistanensis TaxID=992288 RepID=A0ABS2NCT5_9BACI|nr:hypothetical protein [Bacillus pakistanensis]MBM7585645.1 hypothetical protein [Bacillus pakistanensis]
MNLCKTWKNRYEDLYYQDFCFKCFLKSDDLDLVIEELAEIHYQ